MFFPLLHIYKDGILPLGVWRGKIKQAIVKCSEPEIVFLTEKVQGIGNFQKFFGGNFGTFGSYLGC